MIEAQPADLSGLHSRYVNPGELDVLIQLIASVGARSVLEIGANTGRTAKAILRNVPGIERYFGVDVPADYCTPKVVQRKEVLANPGSIAMDDPRFRLIICGRGSFDLMPSDLPKMDAVFIDGGHEAAAVRHDYALARAILNPGGIVIFHDDHGRDVVDVSTVLDDLQEEGEDVVHVAGTWLAFQIMPNERDPSQIRA
ncbi:MULTISPECIES: class I SAM-dependent methyltransferase [unclassified Bradyrhizobium]